MAVPFLKEEWGWIMSDQCWWCSEGRQNRKHTSLKNWLWEYLGREDREGTSWKTEEGLDKAELMGSGACVISYLLSRCQSNGGGLF